MRDRLIELLKSATVERAVYTSDGEIVDTYKTYAVDSQVIGKLADYLLANGVIVPPCKVGDKIYTIYPYGSDIFEHTVHAISANANEQATDIRLCAYDEDRDNARYSSAWIGRNVFTSRKDAEKAIAEREYTK